MFTFCILAVCILYSSFNIISLYFEYSFFLYFCCYYIEYAEILPLHDQLNDNSHPKNLLCIAIYRAFIMDSVTSVLLPFTRAFLLCTTHPNLVSSFYTILYNNINLLFSHFNLK